MNMHDGILGFATLNVKTIANEYSTERGIYKTRFEKSICR